MPTIIERFPKNTHTRLQVDAVAQKHTLAGASSSVVTEDDGNYVVTTVLPEPAADAVVEGAAAGAAAGVAAAGPLGAAAGAAAGAVLAAVAPTMAVAAAPTPAAGNAGGEGGLVHLSTITNPFPISELDETKLRELQTALSRLGYPVGTIDGLFGPKTRNAWAEFKTDVLPGNTTLIGPESVAALRDWLQKLPSAAATDFSSKETTIKAIKQECLAQEIGLPTQMAYVLATTQWETAQTFKPVREAFWKSEDWRKENLRYYPFYGRGYVQLTWEKNYKTYSDLLGVDMVGNPDLALEPNIALFVLVHGFKTGTFTGRKITDYIDASRTDFVNARRCINGMDKAHEIAKLAQAFLASSGS